MDTCPAGTVRPNTPSLLQVALVGVFCHSNRKGANAEPKMELESKIFLYSWQAAKVPSRCDRLRMIRILNRSQTGIPRDRYRRGKCALSAAVSIGRSPFQVMCRSEKLKAT